MRRHIGERNARQAHDAFGEQGIGVRRHKVVVGEEDVGGAEAAGGAVSDEIGDLDRRGSACKNEQPAGGGMPAAVDQDIDGVGANGIGKLRIRQADAGTPVSARENRAQADQP